MKIKGTLLPLRSSGSSSRRVREGGSPLGPGADRPLLFRSPLPNLISPFPLSYFRAGRLPCFEANLPLSLGEVPVPERRSARRRWNSLRSRGLHMEVRGLPSKPKAPRLNGSKKAEAHCFRRQRQVPERSFQPTRRWSEGIGASPPRSIGYARKTCPRGASDRRNSA